MNTALSLRWLTWLVKRIKPSFEVHGQQTDDEYTDYFVETRKRHTLLEDRIVHCIVDYHTW